jgi:hypothetical protein
MVDPYSHLAATLRNSSSAASTATVARTSVFMSSSRPSVDDRAGVMAAAIIERRGIAVPDRAAGEPARSIVEVQSKKESSALKFVVTLLGAFGSLISSANAQQEFIVTGDRIINSRVQQEYVRLSERIPISQLKRRFARYKITSTAGEDCNVCATVSRNAFQFEVHYDEDGIVVIGNLLQRQCMR